MSDIRYDNPIQPGVPNNSHTYALDFVGHAKRVLELGCSTGQVSRILTARGCEVVGVEIDAQAALVAGDHAADVLVADLDTDDIVGKLDGRRFEVVLMGDVLEHLRNPARALSIARSVLDPGGSIVVSLPNIAHVDLRLALLQGVFTYTDWGLLDRTHVSFFTKASAEELLCQSGFVPLELRRVIVPAFTSEVVVDRDAISPEIVTQVLADPEAEVYQYVYRAVPDVGDAYVASVAAALQRSDEELRSITIEHALTKAELEASRRDAAALECELTDARQRLEAWQQTKLVRYSSTPRQWYSALRGLGR